MNRTLNRWLSIAAAGVAVAVGWWVAGMWTGSGRDRQDGSHDGPAQPGWLPGTAGRSLREEMRRIGEAGQPHDHITAAVALASRIDARDLGAFLNNLHHLPSHGARGMASRTVLRRWVALDPMAALHWCATNDVDLIDGVLQEWTHLTPPQELEHFLDQVPSAHRSQAIPSVFNALAATDPEAAIALLARPEAGLASLHGIRHALNQMARQDPAWLIQRAESLPDQVRQSLRGVATAAMAESSPADAIAWAMDQPDRSAMLHALNIHPKHLTDALAAIATMPHREQNQVGWNSTAFHQLMGSDVTGFIDAIAVHHERLSPHFLQSILGTIDSTLVRSDDPGALANRLLELGGSRDFPVGTFVLDWADRSPEAARAWARSLQDESLRREAMLALEGRTKRIEELNIPISDRLFMQAHEGTIEHPNRLGALTEDQRRRLFQTEVDRLQKADPADPNHLSFWENIAPRFPPEAARVLTQSMRPENTDALIRPIAYTASRWAAENPQAAADWAATLPPGHARAWAAANIVGQWQYFDEPAARAWVDSLPPDERATATQGFTR